MKALLTLLVSLSLISAQASAVVPKPTKVHAAPPAASAAQKQTRARALQVTLYFTDALRLNARQATAVRRATLRELQQPKTSTKKASKRSYDQTMKSILSAEQYTAFHDLKDRKPAADLLKNSAIGQ